MDPNTDSTNNPRKKWSLTDRDIPVPRSSPAYIIYYQQILKKTALKKYGGEKPKCVCCGFDDWRFLEIDHIDSSTRLKKGRGRFNLAWWLERNNYPEGFQVLCSFCNKSKKDNIVWTGKCQFHTYLPPEFW